MRIFAISDLHVDYEENFNWLVNLSNLDFKNDMLIVAGDISDLIDKLKLSFGQLTKKFSRVFYVVGNHDLWVIRNKIKDSIQSFGMIQEIAQDNGVITTPFHFQSFSIIPLYGWYDYSFGTPQKELNNMWVDYYACKWPENFNEAAITEYFVSMNEDFPDSAKNNLTISFSHFLPRIDLMPLYIPYSRRILYPVLGTSRLETQIRKLKSQIHIYGHSHVNANTVIDGIRYLNNAYGYPNEHIITKKKLLCVHEI